MKTRVGVIRGGRGAEYDVSLKTGASVLSALSSTSTERYQPIDILITKDGLWYVSGMPIRPETISDYTDVAFIALHGEYGEDGQVQQMLDELRLPYTGSGRIASALGMNKAATKKILQEAGVRMPYGVVLEDKSNPTKTAQEIFHKISPPWVVKPNDRGSSIGLSFARTLPELIEAIEHGFRFSDSVLVEEYLRGREASCGVVDNFRRERVYSLLPVEILRPMTCPIWTYDDKYSGKTNELCPGRFTDTESEELQRLARIIHETLGLSHYSRSDFIITSRGTYALETNTLPGLTSESILPKALAAVGCSYPNFIEHLLELALSEKRGMMA